MEYQQFSALLFEAAAGHARPYCVFQNSDKLLKCCVIGFF
jgi:hypothetical protein